MISNKKVALTNQRLLLTVVLILCIGSASNAAVKRGSANRQGYFPLAVGNWWDYYLVKDSRREGKSLRWKVTQIETIRGNPTFYLWLRPADSDEPLILSRLSDGIVEADTARYVIKNVMHPGDRWIAKSSSLRSVNRKDALEVVSVGLPCESGGHRFSACATIREIDEANNAESLTTYARGVGPVKYIFFKNPGSREITTEMTIRSWKVD